MRSEDIAEIDSVEEQRKELVLFWLVRDPKGPAAMAVKGLAFGI
jgi:hypothetical protein